MKQIESKKLEQLTAEKDRNKAEISTLISKKM